MLTTAIPYPAGSIDPSVARFLAARTEGDREERLTRLIQADAVPVIEAVLSRRAVTGSILREEIDDLRMQAIGAVIRKLQAVFSGEGEAVESIKSYSAMCAHTACDSFYRKRFPVRARLAAQAVYVLKRQPGFALWDAGGSRLAGYDAWRSKAPRPDRTRLATMREKVEEAAGEAFIGLAAAESTVADCIDRVLKYARGPIELELLVHILAEGRGERDLVRALDLGESETALDFVPGQQMNAQASVVLRDYLHALWEEIRDLPKRQTIALLLNFRDDKGRGILTFFLLCGISTVQELAETMGMNADELGDIWNDLPWDDIRIAKYLGCTSLDVSNLRSVARRRLARHMERASARTW